MSGVIGNRGGVGGKKAGAGRRGGLSPQQSVFVAEYLADLNGAEAARRAGYRHPAKVAARLLSYPHVQRAIQEAMQRREARTQVTSDRVVTELARIAFANIRQIFDNQGQLLRPDQIGDEIAAAIASMEVSTRRLGEGEVENVAKIKLLDKVRALELLGKHLGMFSDRLKVEGEVKFTVIDYDPSNRPPDALPAGMVIDHPLIKGGR